MMTLNLSRKKKAVIFGLVMGLGASFVAMPMVVKPTHANVATQDLENIAKTIEMIQQTINIYNTNAQQLILQTINMEKWPKGIQDKVKEQMEKSDDWAWVNNSNVTQTVETLKKIGEWPSILNQTTSPEDILKNQMGDLGAIWGDIGIFGHTNADGTKVDSHKLNVPDTYEMAQKNTSALNSSFVAAANSAQAIQQADTALTQSVDEAVEAANNAEGDMQVQQALVAISAANVRATENGNKLLAQLVATQSQKGYAENLEKAATAQLEEVSKRKLEEWVSKW